MSEGPSLRLFHARAAATARLQQFLHTYYQDDRPSTDIYILPPHLYSAAALPWETAETFSKN